MLKIKCLRFQPFLNGLLYCRSGWNSPDLFERVELEDLEARDVEDADEVDLLHGGVDEGVVAHVDEVAEEAAEDVLGDGAHRDLDGVQVLGLVHPLGADLLWMKIEDYLATSLAFNFPFNYIKKLLLLRMGVKLILLRHEKHFPVATLTILAEPWLPSVFIDQLMFIKALSISKENVITAS